MSILFIDKPKGLSSFDVCFRLRKKLGTKKIGHTGTLDPNASGVMIVLSDKQTKLNQFIVSRKKEYIATVLIGKETDTLDIDGQVINEKDEKMPDKEIIKECLNKYLGKSKQEVPLTSAIHVDGKRLYEYQRENKKVELPLRDIEVFDIELISVSKDEFEFKVTVSGGTYIRSLVRDILRDLGIIGTLKELRRTAIDKVRIDECQSLDSDELTDHDAYDFLKDYYPVYEADNMNDILNGKPLNIDRQDDEILIVNQKKVLAIYYKDDDLYRCKRGLL